MMKQIAFNRKAWFDYYISDNFEAGLVLEGPEIKAIRDNRVNISGSYIKPFVTTDGATELWWVGSHFNIDGDQSRTKKLLMHRQEINRLAGKLTDKGFTVIPLELYLKNGMAKLKIGLGASKKKEDKRQVIKKRETDREIQRRLNSKKKS